MLLLDGEHYVLAGNDNLEAARQHRTSTMQVCLTAGTALHEQCCCARHRALCAVSICYTPVWQLYWPRKYLYCFMSVAARPAGHLQC